MLRSKKVRALIVNNYNNLLKTVDAIISPGSSNLAIDKLKLKSKEERTNIIDDYLQLANFSGTPSITIPWEKYKGIPLGLNITSAAWTDEKLLNIANHILKLLGGENV